MASAFATDLRTHNELDAIRGELLDVYGRCVPRRCTCRVTGFGE
ncbi:hypothetical protein ACFYO9_29275 [Streptomyces sp. NPDC005863]